MKKLIGILMISLFTILLITSCKKDSATTKNPNDLSGTSWVNTTSANGTTTVETLSFTSATEVNDVAVKTGTTNSTASASGTYTYTPPNLKLYANGLMQTATISGNYLYANSSNGGQIIFTKQ